MELKMVKVYIIIWMVIFMMESGKKIENGKIYENYEKNYK